MNNATQADFDKGFVITLAIQATACASVFTPWLARFLGETRVISHLGFEHRLSRWRGVWYHTGIEEVTC